MAIIDVYANQIAVFVEASGVDAYGDPIEKDSITIKCRKEPYEEIVLGKNGEAYKTKAMYFIPRSQLEDYEPKAWLDTIDNDFIVQVNTLVHFNGKIEGYEAIV